MKLFKEEIKDEEIVIALRKTGGFTDKAVKLLRKEKKCYIPQMALDYRINTTPHLLKEQEILIDRYLSSFYRIKDGKLVNKKEVAE